MSPDEEGLPESSEDSAEDIPNAASVPQIRKAREKQRKAQSEASEFWAEVMASIAGRREMWNLLAECGTFETRFGASPSGVPDPIASWFYAGQTALGQRLYRKLMLASPIGLQIMHRENDSGFKPVLPPKQRNET